MSYTVWLHPDIVESSARKRQESRGVAFRIPSPVGCCSIDGVSRVGRLDMVDERSEMDMRTLSLGGIVGRDDRGSSVIILATLALDLHACHVSGFGYLSPY